jgi:hypothetical protein
MTALLLLLLLLLACWPSSSLWRSGVGCVSTDSTRAIQPEE